MEKLLAGSARHLELDGGLRKVEYLMLNLPYLCNYRCLKCCNYGRDVNKTAKSMSFEEIKKLIKDAKKLEIRVLVIAGEGEPFLHPKIRNIIKEAHKNGLVPYIFTNGSLLENDWPYFLKENNASLVINLDSLKKEIYEKLSGTNGSFEQVHKNIKIIREVFSDTHFIIENYALRRVAINTVVNSQNVEELDKVQKFCADDFAFVANMPINIGRAENGTLYKKVIFNLKTIPLGTTSDNKWCAYMRNGISVGSGGEILICAYSLESANSLGNVREGGLKKHLGKANEIVDKFYAAHKRSRCILRHTNYKKFTKGLKERDLIQQQ